MGRKQPPWKRYMRTRRREPILGIKGKTTTTSSLHRDVCFYYRRSSSCLSNLGSPFADVGAAFQIDCQEDHRIVVAGSCQDAAIEDTPGTELFVSRSQELTQMAMGAARTFSNFPAPETPSVQVFLDTLADGMSARYSVMLRAVVENQVERPSMGIRTVSS